MASALFACVDFYFQFPAPAGFGAQFIWLQVRRLPPRARPVLRSQHAGQLLRVFPGDDRGRAARAARRTRRFRAAACCWAGGLRRGPGALLLARLSAQCAGGHRGPDLSESRPHPARQILLWPWPVRGAGQGAGAARAVSRRSPALTGCASPPRSQYLFSETEGLLSGRVASWRAVLGFLAQHPWHALFGIGYKTLPYSDYLGRTR